jgi:hypothetical protein
MSPSRSVTPPAKQTRWVLRGSLVQWSRRCGRKQCRCLEGDLHVTPALSFSQGGRTHFITLPAVCVEPVRQALQRYSRKQAALDQQVQASLQGLQDLRAELRRQRSRS